MQARSLTTSLRQPETVQTPWILLADGRRLAYSEFGDHDGYPLLYLHSHASSASEAGFLHHDALVAGFRLIAVDRPGIGFSDSRRLSSQKLIAADLIELADSLQLTRFGLLARAGGSPFAFTLAQGFSERVSLLISLSTLPFQQQGAPDPGLGESLSRLSLSAMRAFISIRHLLSTRNPEDYLQRLGDGLCFSDRKLLHDPRVIQRMAFAIAEARRQGGRALARDCSLCLQPQPFAPAELRVPVHLWHGSADSLVPLHQACTFARQLPNALLRRVSHRGHLFFMQDAQEVFTLAREELQREHLARTGISQTRTQAARLFGLAEAARAKRYAVL